MRGIDLYTVSKLLGHSSLEVTERYAHLAPDYLKNAVNVLVYPAAVALEVVPAKTVGSEDSVSASYQSRGPVAQKDRAAVS